MKNIYLTFIILLVCCAFANAQKTKNTTEFGVGIGLNGSYVTDQVNNQSDPLSGFNAAISADHYFSDRWSIKGKLVYDQKGWANGYITTSSNLNINNVNFKLTYLTVPVMANWHFGRNRNWYLNFGPYVGFLLNATESTNTVADTKSFFNSTDGGLALGIGIKLPIGEKANFFIEYGGQGGVVNIFKSSPTSTAAQNVTESFNIGIGF